MKHDVMASVYQMQSDDLQQLGVEISEAVAKAMPARKNGRTSIKVVDLWNIRRNSRSAHSLLRRRAV